eukprot:1177019-Prorocentrum_minimum.AAC.5
MDVTQRARMTLSCPIGKNIRALDGRLYQTKPDPKRDRLTSGATTEQLTYASPKDPSILWDCLDSRVAPGAPPPVGCYLCALEAASGGAGGARAPQDAPSSASSGGATAPPGPPAVTKSRT